MHLSRVQLLAAYACTECGRCTDECPANQTGKLLSPRKIMMDTRHRAQEVSANILQNKGTFVPDQKALLGDYITPEELWACTTCAACVEACPMEISPLFDHHGDAPLYRHGTIRRPRLAQQNDDPNGKYLFPMGLQSC